MNPTRLSLPCAGYDIAADWYDGAPGRVLLVLPGWDTGRARYKNEVSEICAETGMGALVIDYSGHGDSPFDKDDTRPAQHFLEVICAFDWLRQSHPKAAITVFGSSYGGYLATQLTKYREFAQLLLRAPAIYPPQDFYTLNRQLHGPHADRAFRHDAEALANHPLLARASGFQGRTAVIVHELDESVPKATTDAFIRTFHADHWTIPEMKHSLERAKMTPAEKQAYYEYIVHWLLPE
jgi:pimeloyl-ACP methyl ester carboxylesterase